MRLTLSNMVKQSKTATVKTISFRATKEEVKMINELKERIGIRADGDIIRMGLRCLWDKKK